MGAFDSLAHAPQAILNASRQFALSEQLANRFQKLVSKSGVQLQTPMMTPTFRLLGVSRFAVFVAFFWYIFRFYGVPIFLKWFALVPWELVVTKVKFFKENKVLQRYCKPVHTLENISRTRIFWGEPKKKQDFKLACKQNARLVAISEMQYLLPRKSSKICKSKLGCKINAPSFPISKMQNVLSAMSYESNVLKIGTQALQNIERGSTPIKLS